MITSQNLRTITDMRRDADGLLRLAAERKEPIGILKNNQLKAYLVDARILEKLEEFVEDVIDGQLVEERLIKAKPSDFRDYDELRKKYKLGK